MAMKEQESTSIQLFTDQDGIVVSREGIAFIVEHAAKVALEEYRKKALRDKEERRNKRLHNTKLLLRIYRELKAHSDSAIYSIDQCDEDVYDVLEEIARESGAGGMEISSIKSSVARTRLIIEHIDKMLDMYSQRCGMSKKPEDYRRCRVIDRLYLADPGNTAQEIAEAENIDLRTVYKDVDAACEKLSAYIFGIDWIS
jgi:hypothetical protein